MLMIDPLSRKVEVDIVPLLVLVQIYDEGLGTVMHPRIVQGSGWDLTNTAATTDLPLRGTRRINRNQVFSCGHPAEKEIAVRI